MRRLTASLVTSTALLLGYVIRLGANDLQGPGAVIVISVIGSLQLCAPLPPSAPRHAPLPCPVGRAGGRGGAVAAGAWWRPHEDDQQ